MENICRNYIFMGISDELLAWVSKDKAKVWTQNFTRGKVYEEIGRAFRGRGYFIDDTGRGYFLPLGWIFNLYVLRDLSKRKKRLLAKVDKIDKELSIYEDKE